MSPTSSNASSPTRSEWRVVVCVIVGLLTAEAVTRLFETGLSQDIRNIRDLPSTAKAMARHDGAKLLFIGNSLTRRAIADDLIIEAAAKAGRTNPGVFFFTPDGTNITNWDYGFRRYFASTLPDEVFIGTGAQHLEDSSDDAIRLGCFYVSGADVPRAMREDLPSWEQRARFLLARCSALYADRSRVKPLAFWRLIPHYFDIEQKLNKERYTAEERNVASQASFRHFESLLAMLKEHHILTHIVTIPLPKKYTLPQAALEVIERQDATLHDLGSQAWLDASAFGDGYHLTPEAARKFSATLAQAVFTRPL